MELNSIKPAAGANRARRRVGLPHRGGEREARGEALQREARDGAQSAAQELGSDLFRSFEAVVAEVAASGRLNGEPRAAAQALWAGAHGVVSLMITKPYFDWVSREALTRTTLDALFVGLLKP